MRAAARGQIVRDAYREYFVDPGRLSEIGEKCERKVFELFVGENPTRKQEGFARFEAKRTRYILAVGGLYNDMVTVLGLRELDQLLSSGKSFDEAIDFLASRLRDHTEFGHLIIKPGPTAVPNDELVHLLSIVLLSGHDTLRRESQAGGACAALCAEFEYVRNNLDPTTLRLWHERLSREFERAGRFDLTLSAFAENMAQLGLLLEQAVVASHFITLFFFKWYALPRDAILGRLEESRTAFETNSWLIRGEIIDLQTPLLREIGKSDPDIRAIWRAARPFFEKPAPQIVGRCPAAYIKHASDGRIDPVDNLLQLGARVFFPKIAYLYDDWIARNRRPPLNASHQTERYFQFIVDFRGVASGCTV